MKHILTLMAFSLTSVLPLLVLAQDAGEDADVQMDAEPDPIPDVVEDVVEDVEQDVPDPVEGGLTGSYFNNVDFTGFALERVDPSIEFNPSADDDLAPGVPGTSLSVRWTGQIAPAYTELYSLHTFSDDGVRLWVDGKLLINNWTDHGRVENVGMVSLRNGELYDVRLEWYQGGGDGTIELRWSSPSQVNELIPSDTLEPVSGVVSQRPEVFIEVVDGEATEGSIDDARALVYRWGDVSQPLTVNLGFGGDVINGEDIVEIPAQVVIPENQSAVRINIVEIDDDLKESDETLELSVVAGDGYSVGEGAAASFVLHDDEIPPPAPVFTITGTLSWDGDPESLVVIAHTEADLGTEVRRHTLVEPGVYALSNLDGGDYFVTAFADLDGDGAPSDDEPIVEYEVDGQRVALTLPPDALSIDLVLTAPKGPSTLEEGCGCQQPTAPASTPGLLAVLVAAVFLFRRKGRRCLDSDQGSPQV